LPGKDLQKVVHTDLQSSVRKDEVWDVVEEAFGDFFTLLLILFCRAHRAELAQDCIVTSNEVAPPPGFF